jgi:imidazolonepropionase-like amidohydrolase
MTESRAVAFASPSAPRRFRGASSLLPATLAVLHALAAGAAGDTLVLTGASVLDPTGQRLVDGQRVVIRDGRIAAIEAPTAGRAATGEQVMDLPGLTLVPGLIDLHTHLLLRPYDEAPWSDQVLRDLPEIRTIRAVVAARRTLEAGFTTIRDLGTEGAGLADVALREAIAARLIPGPRVVAVTRAIVSTACYGPQEYDRRLDLPQGADEATGVDELRRVVRRQVTEGADWIKFYADYHRRPGIAATPSFTQQEMEAIVDEARMAGLPVAAHATTGEGIRRAVRAGVRTIEHGYEATEDALKLMAERGVVLCPTLAAAEAYDRYDIAGGLEKEQDRLRRAKETVRRALQVGVTIACGSDAGVFSHGDNAREIELMVECGMSAGQALRAATAGAAEVLGVARDCGRVEAGCAADLVAVRGDPLRNISALRQVVVVIRSGRVEVDRR